LGGYFRINDGRSILSYENLRIHFNAQKDCLALFDSNTPYSFAPQERETFQGFLNKLAPPFTYFVVRDNDEKIVACGGIKLEPAKHSAWLRWDMVERELHDLKIGTFLAFSRLFLICQSSDIQVANLCTSQHSYQFYKKIGFSVQRVIPNGIVPGMDEYFMELRLDEEQRARFENFSESGNLV